MYLKYMAPHVSYALFYFWWKLLLQPGWSWELLSFVGAVFCVELAKLQNVVVVANGGTRLTPDCPDTSFWSKLKSVLQASSATAHASWTLEISGLLPTEETQVVTAANRLPVAFHDDLHSDLCLFLSGTRPSPPAFCLFFWVLLRHCLQLSINVSCFVNL